MAIGDNTNSNLFGTNYNPEDEEEKKARLAAQGAMMGAGNIPASAFGQAPAVAPFSLEAAGQVNPMMQPQSLEVTPQPQVTFRDYDAPEPPRASALSVFAPGGDVKPGIDVNAITPAPEMISPSAVNTALNQEVPVGSPENNDPSFMSRLGSFFNPSGASGGGAGLPPTFTPPSAGATQAQEGTDITPVTLESLGLESSGQRILREGLTQAPSGASALGATPSVTPPVERPMAGAQEQPEAVVSPFLQSPNTPSGLGGPLLRGFDMVNDAARGPNAPMGQDATRAALGGMTLNEYLNAPAGTEGVSGLRTDPQGRMITPSAQPSVDSAVPSATTQPPVDALSSFEQDSLSRQQRIGGTGSFEGDSEARDARVREMDRRPGESQADRDTRVAQSKTTGGQTGGLSFDDARRRAEGQLAARGVKNPSASQVNALARGIQAGEPERLAELETKRAKDVVDLKTAQATLDRPEFEGRVYTVNGVTFAQTSRGGAQVIDTGTETSEESTAKMKDFVFALEQIDKARKAYQAGDIDKANDIITAAGIQKNGFDVTASEYFGDATTPVTPSDPASTVTASGLTQQQEAGIQRVMADNEITREEAIKALKKSGQLK